MIQLNDEENDEKLIGNFQYIYFGGKIRRIYVSFQIYFSNKRNKIYILRLSIYNWIFHLFASIRFWFFNQTFELTLNEEESLWRDHNLSSVFLVLWWCFRLRLYGFLPSKITCLIILHQMSPYWKDFRLLHYQHLNRTWHQLEVCGACCTSDKMASISSIYEYSPGEKTKHHRWYRAILLAFHSKLWSANP